jgi:hypothetical protein
MLARGFWREMLAELVLAGFAMAVSETIRTGGPTIKVERYRITTAGRRARSKVDLVCGWASVNHKHGGGDSFAVLQFA